jgi:hypothetical protein
MALISTNTSNLYLNTLDSSSANTSASANEDIESSDAKAVLHAMQTALERMKVISDFFRNQITQTILTDSAEQILRKGELSISSTQEKWRVKYAPLFEKICNKISNEFQLKDANILEIGSGKLFVDLFSYQKHSFLSYMFSDCTWTYSDIPVIAFQNAGTTSEKYIPVDLIGTVDKVEGSFNAILGCSVLDSLPYDKLSKAFSNISKMLKPKDLCIHIADLNLFSNPYYEKVAQENADSVLLPGKDLTNNAIYIIKNQDFTQILKKKKDQLSSKELSFFDHWSRQSVTLQAATLMDFDCVYREGRSQLVERIENIFSTKLKEENIQNKFDSYFKKAAEKNGFAIVKCGLDSEYLIELDSGNNRQNYHLFKNGLEHFSKCVPLAPNLIYKEAYVHIFIAKKM